MKNLTTADRILLFFSTIILMVFSYFLYDDSLLFPRADDSGFEQIGKVYYLQNDVRLKNASQFSWLPAENEANVHQKDSVFTGKGSEAAIQLQDGTIINLKENSLVTLNIKEGQMTLDLKYGDFVGQISETSTLKVKSGKETFELKAEKSANNEKPVVLIKKARAGQVDFKLTQGAAKIESPKAKESLVLNQSVSLEPKTIPPKSPPTEISPKAEFKLLTLDKTSFSRSQENEHFRLHWDIKPNNEPVDIEIAKDTEFTNIVASKQSIVGEYIVSTPLPDGNYFWRLKNSSGQTSSVNQFFLKTAGSPTWLTPMNNAELMFEMPHATPIEKQSMEVPLRWKMEPPSTNYQVQIASDETYSQNQQMFETKSTNFLPPKFKSGKYFARVRAHIAQEKWTGWSSNLQFSVLIKVKELAPSNTPVLVKEKITYDPNLVFRRNPAATHSVDIGWSKPPNVASYKLEISPKEDFSEVQTIKTEKATYTFTQIKPGVQYFRVSAISKDGLESKPSKTGVLKVITGTINLSPLEAMAVVGNKAGQEAPKKEIQLKWSPMAFATKYLVQYDQNQDFTKPTELEASTTNLQIPITNPGNYYFRVKALGENNAPLGDFSNVETATYSFKAPLLPPKAKEPMPNVSIFLQKDTEPLVWLDWVPVKEAVSYTLEVSTTPDFKNNIISTKLDKNRYLIKDKLPFGKVYWRVRAIAKDPEMNSNWTTNNFSLLFNKKEEFSE